MRRFDVSRAMRTACVAVCAPFMFQATWGQGASPGLSLEAALASALVHHPDVRAAALEQQALQGATQQAGALPNPELSTLVEDAGRASPSTTVSLSQPIELGGKRTARIGAAQAAQDQAALEVASQRAHVSAQVTAAFHAAAVAQKRVMLLADLGRLATQAREVVGKRVLAGKASPVEELKAQLAQAQALSVSAVAHSEWRAAMAQLRQAVGDPALRFDRVDATLAPLPLATRWAPWLDGGEQHVADLDAAPAIAQARQEVLRKQALSEMERARRTPDLSLTLGAKRDPSMGRDQAIVGVSLMLPLFDRNQGAILEAIRREDKARVELVAVRARVRAQAEQAWSQLIAALAQARTLREEVLPAARQALVSSTKGYELGKFGVLDVLDAQRTLFEAETQVLHATVQAHEADARLLSLLGEPTAKKD